MAVVLVEVVPGDVWEFAFWNHDPDGIAVTYRCQMNRAIWMPVETPSYTGVWQPWENDESRFDKKPWHADPEQ